MKADSQRAPSEGRSAGSLPGTTPLARRARGALVVAAAACALSLSGTAQAEEPVRDERADPDTFPPGGARANLFVAGAVTTAVWYGAAVSFSYLWPDAPGADDLRIPVAGPWMALADTGCADTDPNCSTFTVVLRAILTTIDAVGQVGGLLIMAEGAFLTTASPRKAKPRPRVSVAPAPVVTGDALGLGLVGSF